MPKAAGRMVAPTGARRLSPALTVMSFLVHAKGAKFAKEREEQQLKSKDCAVAFLRVPSRPFAIFA
ncbi:hypothetical protein [Gemmatimonas sp.]|uniref:hypothetical protein n=1 Tax=Gemmatimonas sp. TaxID=1962908 RepID=UPI00286DCE64|nr:hypothetical protein [Gemmatimonas sp.]